MNTQVLEQEPVRQVEALFSLANQIQAAFQSAEWQVAKLTRFLLAHAWNPGLPARSGRAFLPFMALAVFVLLGNQCAAENLPVKIIKLPPLRIQGKSARAHSQGLEIVSTNYYVTARREDVLPKRALLLRTDAHRRDWDVWDTTPTDARGDLTALNHPGGMQSDGKRLWIPLAESKRHGRTQIRAFAIAGMVAGQTLKAEVDFSVNDHIGAVAVSAGRRLIFGANWDTEVVYVWDFEGRLQQTLKGPELEARGLGVVSGVRRRAGLAVQDWKMIGDRLFASGLFRGAAVVPEPSQSRLVIFNDFSKPEFQQKSISLPKHDGTELAREAMAVSDGLINFLPEDLGPSNRIFQVSLPDLMRQGDSQKTHSNARR
jgi:Family of unknown function (DUF6454)